MVLRIPLIKYPVSLSLHGGCRQIGATPPQPPPPSSERPASYTAGQHGQRYSSLASPTTAMKKETHGFHNFHAWVFYVSPISIGMGLCSPAFRAGEAALLCKTCYT